MRRPAWRWTSTWWTRKRAPRRRARGETGAVNFVGYIVAPDEKPMPLRDRPEKQHRENPLGYGGNSIVQQPSVVPELKRILGDVYLNVAAVER